MNFLSHFYFDRYASDSYHVTGTVLPDLLKNADKTINIHPERLADHSDIRINSLMQGWKRHLLVDRYFHSSEYFIHHSHQLKLALKPAIEGSPVKPFFLGHIALELILDNLLLTKSKIQADEFYGHLAIAEDEHIEVFLNYNSLHDTALFFKFFTDFKKHKYLHTYAETSQIAYALKRICMRVWKDPFTPMHEEQMNGALLNYRSLLATDYMFIFDEIEQMLND